MSLVRTPSGLSNLRLFHHVDAVVIVEGSSGGSEENPASLDIMFWSRLFASFAPQLNLHFLAMGSKTTVLPIANSVAEGLVEGVLVAMDRDYDSELGGTIEHPRVLYTWGYSWENDVWGIGGVMRIIEDHAQVSKIPQDEIDRIRAAYNSFVALGRRLVLVNLAARKTLGEAVVRSAEQLGIVLLRKGAYPSFNRELFSSRLREFNRTKVVPCFGTGVTIVAERHLNGHLYAHFCASLVVRGLSRVAPKATANYELLAAMAVKNFVVSELTLPSQITSHYRATFLLLAGEHL